MGLWRTCHPENDKRGLNYTHSDYQTIYIEIKSKFSSKKSSSRVPGGFPGWATFWYDLCDAQPREILEWYGHRKYHTDHSGLRKHRDVTNPRRRLLNSNQRNRNFVSRVVFNKEYLPEKRVAIFDREHTNNAGAGFGKVKITSSNSCAKILT